MQKFGPSATDDFAALILRSGLLDFDGLAAAYHAFRQSARGAQSVEAFATYLVQTESLTEWQCAKLQNGRWKGFYLDHYRLFDRLRVNATSTSYLARDMHTGRNVVLQITPPTDAAGTIHYTVEPHSREA